jgi:hypothetical protein
VDRHPPRLGRLLKSGLLKPSTSPYQLPALPAGRTLWARIYTGVASGWGNWQDISFTTAAAGSSSSASMTLTRQTTITNQLTAHAALQPTPAWMRRLLALEPDLHQSSRSDTAEPASAHPRAQRSAGHDGPGSARAARAGRASSSYSS